jgi:thioredoxin-like negative regulator of GroEL
MRNITDLEELEKLRDTQAIFILFGGEHCQVCKALRPKLSDRLHSQFPKLQAIYIDCEKSPEICAQFSVFSLPAVKVFIEGGLITEDARAFGMHELMQRIERSYSLWAGE